MEVKIVSIPMLTLRHQRSLMEIDEPDILNACLPIFIRSQREEIRERGCVILRELDTCFAFTASYSLVSAFPSLEGAMIGKMLLEVLKSMNGPMFMFHLSPN